MKIIQIVCSPGRETSSGLWTEDVVMALSDDGHIWSRVASGTPGEYTWTEIPAPEERYSGVTADRFVEIAASVYDECSAVWRISAAEFSRRLRVRLYSETANAVPDITLEEWGEIDKRADVAMGREMAGMPAETLRGIINDVLHRRRTK